MSKFLISFIFTTIIIMATELILLAYVLIQLDTKEIWLEHHHNFIIFIATSIILIFSHIFWVYSFVSSYVRYQKYLKLNDTLVSISLCLMVFVISWILLIIIATQQLGISRVEVIVLSIIFLNILLLIVFNIFILFNFNHFNHRFVKNILMNSENENFL